MAGALTGRLHKLRSTLMIVVRLQTIVSRELAATHPVVLTVGSVQAGTSGNVIPESAELLVNVRTYDEDTRQAVLAAVRRIVKGECDASWATREPQIEEGTRFPPTVNDEAVTRAVSTAFATVFGKRSGTVELQSASEDFSRIPDAFGIPYTYWALGCIDPDTHQGARQRGTVAEDVPVNHSPRFAPVLQPTAVTRTSALVGSLMTESGTFSTRTSPAPCMRVARMRCSPMGWVLVSERCWSVDDDDVSAGPARLAARFKPVRHGRTLEARGAGC
ncbi:peptidase dimerization domain-containing protein [Streptomyces sp. NBC_00996]|uniref:peptidase dimerization domain-containing protein n=1 Tax=Streptomyces sp. NBC_00996 TaxID=2903710 RepID=UPI0038637C59